MTKPRKPSRKLLDDQQRWKDVCDSLAEDAATDTTQIPTEEEEALAKRVKKSLQRLTESHADAVEQRKTKKKHRSR